MWPASSPARPVPSRSRRMSALPNGPCRAKTWTKSTGSRQTSVPPALSPARHSREKLNMDVRLDGKSAIVTGGSKGLGLAIAEEYFASGADVAVLARNPDTLAEAKQKIQGRGGKGKIAAISCDVSKAADIRKAYDQIMSEFGKVDIYVNNAGQSTRGPSEE